MKFRQLTAGLNLLLTMWLLMLLLPFNTAHAAPICTPNMTPEQAFLAIKYKTLPSPTTITTNTITQPSPSQNTIATSSPININTASESELATIKGIGTKKAQDIILYREMIAPFKTIDELDNVKGIGKATIEKNRAILSIGDGQTVAK